MTDNLPEVEFIKKEDSRTFYLDKRSNYDELMETFVSLVYEDCRAITCDGDIIYNVYKKMTIRESIQEYLIRGSIVENCYSAIFVNIFQKNESSTITLYMSGEYPWFVLIRFHPDVRCVTMEYYMSKKFQDAFQPS
uniref:Uncharacterized protein n=1 Tax=viral metagenome TaxID=1070528 RepID=A0A6C0DJP9_9ZZZZ